MRVFFKLINLRVLAKLNASEIMRIARARISTHDFPKFKSSCTIANMHNTTINHHELHIPKAM